MLVCCLEFKERQLLIPVLNKKGSIEEKPNDEQREMKASMTEVNGPQKPEKKKETNPMGQPSRKQKQASPQALEGTKVKQGRINGQKSLK